MPTTTTWSIDYPNGSSAITPLESHFEALAESTDDALTSLKADVRGANSTATIASLATAINATNTRLALNLQDGAGAPSGSPSNGGVEGSMYYDTTNDALYLWNNTDWKKIWNDTGWINTGLTNGLKGTVGSSQYRVIGNIVHFRLAGTITVGDTANTSGNLDNTQILMMPAEIRPSYANYITGNFSGDKPAVYVFGTDGAVTLIAGLASVAYSAGSTAFVTLSWPLG